MPLPRFVHLAYNQPMTTVILVTFLLTSMLTFWLADHLVNRISRTYYLRQVDLFSTSPIQPGDIVLLGDSLTDLGIWHEMLPGVPVRNRGISNDTTEGVLERLDQVISGKPKAVFLLIGTNDLPWFIFSPDRDILKTYEQILARLREETPETVVFVQSLLPRHARYAPRIRKFNHRLQMLAERYACPYVDLYPHFATAKGALRRDMTNDDLHLNGTGYRTWVEQIQPLIESLD